VVVAVITGNDMDVRQVGHISWGSIEPPWWTLSALMFGVLMFAWGLTLEYKPAKKLVLCFSLAVVAVASISAILLG
jgi:hypothetical protein